LKLLFIISLLTLNVFANCVFFISQEFEYKGKKYKPCEDYQVVYDHSYKLKNKWTLEYPSFDNLEFRNSEIYFNSFKKRKTYENKSSIVISFNEALNTKVTINEKIIKPGSNFYNNLEEEMVLDGIERNLRKKNFKEVNILQSLLNIFTYYFQSSDLSKKASRLYFFIFDDNLPDSDSLNIKYFNALGGVSQKKELIEKNNIYNSIKIKSVKIDNVKYCSSVNGYDSFNINDSKEYFNLVELMIEDKINNLIYLFEKTYGGDDGYAVDSIFRTLIIDKENGFAIYKNICAIPDKNY
jgi:hypothetical protein